MIEEKEQARQQLRAVAEAATAALNKRPDVVEVVSNDCEIVWFRTMNHDGTTRLRAMTIWDAKSTNRHVNETRASLN